MGWSLKSLAFIGAAFSLAAMASDQWTLKELKEAEKIAFEELAEQKGETIVEKVVGYSVDRNIQGNGAKAKISYLDEKGVKQSVSFFCHVHEGEGIDCH